MLFRSPEELVKFLSFFREKFGLPDIPVRQDSKKGLKYNFPRLPDFSALNKLFTQESGLDFYNKSYAANKAIIKGFQKKQKHKDIKRLLSYLRYMKKQETANHIYLTNTGSGDTKNNYIGDLTKFIVHLEKSGIELKTLKSVTSKKIHVASKKDPKGGAASNRSIERYIKDISCIVQNIKKGIIPGIFTEHDCLPCLEFFTNGKIKYFNDEMYFYPLPILRLIPDRKMDISDALQSDFRVYYLQKIVEKIAK